LFGETVTETNPAPGFVSVGFVRFGITNGVEVSAPIKIGMGTKVAVGRLGSCVGKCKMVGEGVKVVVTVGLGVLVGVDVMVGVEEGASVSVGGNRASAKGIPPSNEQACNQIASKNTVYNLRISYLFHAIILRTEFIQLFHFTTACRPAN